MKNGKLSTREVIMILLLAVMLIGLWYYMGFYTPLQNELNSLNAQASELDGQISSATAKLQSMKNMQEELDEILARPESEITEIAPYDNKEVVLNELNGILYDTDYSLSFSDPEINDDGTVRRVVSMSFRSRSYENAKSIITALSKCQWRCLVGNLSISCGDDVMKDEVQVSATITFFESTKLTASTEEA